ncbi:Hypothetical predicted protein [Mytilus galloprovincialis]|uniref:Peptidase aspartic putative domain-containing protein n=1 Tax=Mytilus galloprovincialis TaxID=29158 RepID=A0A8B6ELJ1_MYTGA|nr:Hypothetical predicted protein [Mytilus galloprovincialis]
MHSSTSSVRSQVLLKTAIAPITYDKTHFNTANILFDEGAQRSFITQEMADLLNLRPHRKEAITISGFGESNKKTIGTSPSSHGNRNIRSCLATPENEIESKGTEKVASSESEIEMLNKKITLSTTKNLEHPELPSNEMTPDETTNRVHYIPHQPVKKNSSTTPIRIVYDCSRKDSEPPSLNDCLSSTPPQLNKLTDILTRFQYGKMP